MSEHFTHIQACSLILAFQKVCIVLCSTYSKEYKIIKKSQSKLIAPWYHFFLVFWGILVGVRFTKQTWWMTAGIGERWSVFGKDYCFKPDAGSYME